MNKATPEIKLSRQPGLFSQLPKIVTMAYYSFRAQLRNPATFAFGFIFPIVFISVFGLLGSGGGVNIKLGVPNSESDQTPIFKAVSGISSFKISRDTDSELRNQLTKGQIDALLTTGQNSETKQFQINLETSAVNPTTSAAAQSIISGIVDKMNLGAAQVKQPAFVLTTQVAAGRQFRYIDFALPGMIGFALLSTAIFSTAFGLIFLKKTLVLKRIFATPTRPGSIILGQGLARLVVALLQTILLLAFGIFVFKFHLANGIVTAGEMLLLSTFGLVVFLGFGLFISGISNDENAVAPIANLITLPQFLFSGTFFATDAFPKFVQPIANNLPLSYLNVAMRKVATEGAGITDIWLYLVGLALWGLFAYFLASRTFKWQ